MDSIHRQGLFTIAKPGVRDGFIIWTGDEFVSNEAIAFYKRKEQALEAERYGLLFDVVWNAALYLWKISGIEGGMVYELSDDEVWDRYVRIFLKQGINRAVVNRCIFPEIHKCVMFSIDLREKPTREEALKQAKAFNFAHGYEYKEFQKILSERIKR